ncbi:MAG: M23 family metallopeptidase [Lachnospiraceae bacterium]|nr:M23 family metallopeptidase [Lachnospiraceae bacterium]
MKMTKENMDHIRERFETETGTKLPEKEGFTISPYAARLAAAAAGILCIIGMGLVWSRISADKQSAAGEMLAEGEEDADPKGSEDEESAVPTVGAVDVAQELGDTTDTDTDAVPDPEWGEAPPEKAYAVYASDNAVLVFYGSEGSPKDFYPPVGEWVWPVPASLRMIAVADNGDTVSDKGYISIPGNVGDEVLAMHSAVVRDCGFDPDKGNYIRTEYDGRTIEYCHMEEISVSVGDTLNAGDRIGSLGNSGMSTGPHLGLVAAEEDGTGLSYGLFGSDG